MEIEQSAESLHAHVELDGDVVILPGDEVRVIDAPSGAPMGECLRVRRVAVITRAGPFVRAWTRLVGPFELNGLYDVSFSERRTL